MMLRRIPPIRSPVNKATKEIANRNLDHFFVDFKSYLIDPKTYKSLYFFFLKDLQDLCFEEFF